MISLKALPISPNAIKELSCESLDDIVDVVEYLPWQEDGLSNKQATLKDLPGTSDETKECLDSCLNSWMIVRYLYFTCTSYNYAYFLYSKVTYINSSKLLPCMFEYHESSG